MRKNEIRISTMYWITLRMRNRNTIEYLGLWESLYNPNFKPTEFEGFRKQAGLNAFTLSPQRWIETTGAIGIISKSGRYGGTYAHKDIAFRFASWISVEFELYIAKEFTSQGRRAEAAWMVCKARAGKVELQDSHRCHNERPDTGRAPCFPHHIHICQRGWRPQCSLICLIQAKSQNRFRNEF